MRSTTSLARLPHARRGVVHVGRGVKAGALLAGALAAESRVAAADARLVPCVPPAKLVPLPGAVLCARGRTAMWTTACSATAHGRRARRRFPSAWSWGAVIRRFRVHQSLTRGAVKHRKTGSEWSVSTCGTPQTLPVWNHRKHASFLEVALCKTQALSSSLPSEVAHTGDLNTRWTKEESLAPARLPSRTAVVQHNIRNRHDAVLVQRGDARAQLRLAAIRRGEHFVVARQVALPN